MLAKDKLLERLETRKLQGLYRTLPKINSELIDLYSNDYLGLSTNKTIQKEAQKLLASFDLDINGATGSRLISGNNQVAEGVEQYIANFCGQESSLVFSSGYAANVGLLSAIPQRGDTLIMDELCHASLIDGARLTKANRIRFKHNDLEDLEAKLQKVKGQKIVVAESVYSMDGDVAPLGEMVKLVKANNADLIIDEAHAIGVYGDKGKGLVAQGNLQNDILATVITFGKALGCHGAAVLGSEALKNYLINFARSFIYSTAMPPHAFATLQASLGVSEKMDVERTRLFSLIDIFREKVKTSKYVWLNSPTPIQSVIVPDKVQVRALADALQSKGFAVKAILTPTVPEGKERIRICLHSFNSKEEVGSLFHIIEHYNG